MFALLLGARADAQDPTEQAKAAFQKGVALAEQGHWEAAARSFEDALRIEDRPALRFNLVLAYQALGRYADVILHGEAFLKFPPEEHREEARARVERALSEARAAVIAPRAVEDATTTPSSGEAATRDVQAGAQSGAVGGLRTRADGGRHPLLPAADLPQPHDGQANASGIPPGPRALAVDDAPPSPAHANEKPSPLEPVTPLPRWRTRLAWTLGLMGASLSAAAWITYGMAVRKADELANLDHTQPGTLSRTDRYLGLTDATLPLSLAGGAAMAASIPLGPKLARPSRAWAWTALTLAAGGLAAGLTLAVREPDSVGALRLPRPSRELGMLVMSASAPLFSYAFTFGLKQRNGVRSEKLASRTVQGAGR